MESFNPIEKKKNTFKKVWVIRRKQTNRKFLPLKLYYFGSYRILDGRKSPK